MCPVCLATLASAPYSSSRLMTAGSPDAEASYRMDASSCACDKTSAPASKKRQKIFLKSLQVSNIHFLSSRCIETCLLQVN